MIFSPLLLAGRETDNGFSKEQGHVLITKLGQYMYKDSCTHSDGRYTGEHTNLLSDTEGQYSSCLIYPSERLNVNSSHMIQTSGNEKLAV
jgi:hypothetical protein